MAADPTPVLTHIFFDVGGVLGTNGWDRDQRARARHHFGLDDEIEARHDEVASEFETGAIALDEYLDSVVFFRDRTFSRQAFIDYMLAQSEPNIPALDVARRLASTRDLTLMTMNNESETLNLHRIERFDLRPIFAAFLSSCWLGARKPARRFFHRALAIAQADPAQSLFIDDREQNLCPAGELGMQTLRFRTAAGLQQDLEALGLGG